MGSRSSKAKIIAKQPQVGLYCDSSSCIGNWRMALMEIRQEGLIYQITVKQFINCFFHPYQLITIKPISMKSLYRSNATIDTYQISQSSAHNCPSCRCKSTDPSIKLSHSISQPYLSNPHNEHNLYLSNHLSDVASDKFTAKPYNSSIFHQPTKKITFKYAAVSPKQTNISFSYTSPPKNKKHHSSESKFNTRKFKNLHFPQISHEEDDSVPIKKVVKNGAQSSPYYEVYTKQKTPEKHRILKMKKERSKQKLEITLSKNSSSHQSIQKDEQLQIVCHNPFQSNEYQMEGPRNTPINALWMHVNERSHKSLKNQEIHQYMNKDNIPASIENIQPAVASRRSINIIEVTPVVSQQQLSSAYLQGPQKIVNEGTSHRKYPTIESLDAYETRVYMQNISQNVRTNFTHEETSLRFLKQLSQKQSSLSQPKSEEIELARSISEDLELHFDYYYPQDESDRSLSIHVGL